MPSFAYLGDRDETRLFGLVFRPGVPVPVSDERVIGKLRHNCEFSEVFEGVEVLDASPIIETQKRRGRPPKAKA